MRAILTIATILAATPMLGVSAADYQRTDLAGIELDGGKMFKANVEVEVAGQLERFDGLWYLTESPGGDGIDVDTRILPLPERKALEQRCDDTPCSVRLRGLVVRGSHGHYRWGIAAEDVTIAD